MSTNKDPMSRDFWYDFIQLYKSFPCLWDAKDPSYAKRDQNQKKEAYDVLLAKMQEIDPSANIDTVKRKIDSFRTAFRREEKKVLLSMQSGDDEIHTPILWYYKILEEFLGNNSEERRNHVIAQAVARSRFSNDEEESEAMMNVEYIEEDFSEQSEDEKYTPPTKSKLRALLTERTKSIDKQPSRIFVESLPFTQNTAVENSSQTEEEDDCATFAANLKVQMREIDREQKFIAQKLISDVMFLARTNRLTYNSSVQSNLMQAVSEQSNDVTMIPDVLPNK